MELKTFDTILTGLCDSFDSLISPKTIARSNTNIIYLLFKAIAKGFEVINNACVAVSNKFDPANCSVEDLNSVASLVGTEKMKGSGTGLHIIATNNANVNKTLVAGTYTYALDDDTTFTFEVLVNTEIPFGDYVTFIAMSDEIGKFPVTAQTDITVESNQTIPEGISFSCSDNSALLGTDPETDLEFRKRVLEGYTQQNTIVELENKLKNLPYLFDCSVKFNNTLDPITVEGNIVPPFNAIIFYSGSPRNEMADIIAGKLICPTVQTPDSKELKYYSEVFTNGYQSYYITPFGEEEFKVDVILRINGEYANAYDVKKAIREALVNHYVAEVHKDYVKEEDIYNIITSLNLSGVNVLAVNLRNTSNVRVEFIAVPTYKVPKLMSNGVSFQEV